MNKAERFWDKVADSYEKTEERFERVHTRVIGNTKKHLKQSDTVLDYGCATGTKTFALATHVKSIQGIDISSKMIEGAKRKVAERKIENVQFEHITLFDESLKKESFDVVMAFNILHAIKENRQVVERIAELLKPGGLFITSTPCLKERIAFVNRMQLVFYLILIKAGLVPDMLTLFRIPELEDLVQKSDFQIVETEKLYYRMTSYFIVANKGEKT